MYQADMKLIHELDDWVYIEDIVLSTGAVKIYTIKGGGNKKDWSRKYPYRVIFLDSKNRWQRISSVSPSFDVAYLSYLEHKYCGLNSQFCFFACKMLGIELNG